MRLSFAAFASTKLPSTDRCWPCTNPTSTHWRTICSNNCSNSFDSWNRPCRFFENVMRDLLIEAQAGEPAPRQMHAQFVHQFAFAGDAVQITNQHNAQQEFGIDRGATRLAVAGSKALTHKLKTDVLVDQPQQMVLGNLIFQTEIVEQRFRAVVLPHHDQQASDDRNQTQHGRMLSSNMLLLNLILLIDVTFSTPTPVL